jgi:glyoxalase family protein
VRAYTRDPEASRHLLEGGLAFEPRDGDEWVARGEERGGRIVYDRTDAHGRAGGGTVHHVAWSMGMDEKEEWRERALQAGARATPIIDRFWFRSIYFREPSGVLFELATRGPGFTADESLETLGEALTLPPDYEHLREKLEKQLTPLPDPRQWRRATAGT